MTTSGPFRRRRRRTRALVLTAVAGVVAGAGVFAVVLLASGSGDVEVSGLGDDVFRAGRVETLADAVERDGPVLFSDVSGTRGVGARPIYVHHTRTDVLRGWLAISAVAPGADARCLLKWEGDAAHFVDPCSGATYEPDHPALTVFPTRLDDRFLFVDLGRNA